MKTKLFIGKRIDNGEWVESNCLMQFENENHRLWDKAEGWVKIDNSTLCDFTEVTDKHNYKIFEGHIVSLGDLSAIKICGCYVVKYNAEQARYSLFSASGIEQAGFNQDTMKQYNIIGNIYDNPELLQERK